MSHCRHLGIGVSDAAASSSNAERLIHAADCQFGLSIEILIDAMEVMLRADHSTLQIGHFVEAFRDRAACEDAFNPFLAADYVRIDVRRLFAGKDAK